MSEQKFRVKYGLAVGDNTTQTAMTVDGTTGDIFTNGDVNISGGDLTVGGNGYIYSSSDLALILSGQNITTPGDLTVNGGNITNNTGALEIASTGATNVIINPGSGTTVNDGHMILGQLNTNAILTTNGTSNLDIRTGTFPTSANINLANGANGNITVDTDGTGQVVINADVDINGTIYLDQLQVDNININGNTISSTNANGNINLTPNGTGDVVVNTDLVINGNDIKSNGGTTAITLSSDDVTVAGDLTLNGNTIKSNGGTTAITLSGNAATVAGNLTVTGNDIRNGGNNTVISFTGTNTTDLAGDLVVTGGDITTTQTTATLFNTTATTVNIAGAATTVSIGANTGTTTINNSLVADDISVTTVDTTNLEVTNIKAKDGTAAATIADSTGIVTVSTELNVDNLNFNNSTVSTIGATNLVLNTNNGTNSGQIQITSGASSNILLTPNGSGDVYLESDTTFLGDQNVAATLSTYGTGDLTINTNGGTNSGSIGITAGVDGNITLSPNGTGDILATFSNGGNLINNRNYVFGAIRNATTEGLGDIWALNATGTVGPQRGISVDNSADITKTASYLARTYGATAPSRSRFIFERARGTAASPTAVQAGDFLGEVDATGYSSTGWINDTITVVPAFFGFNATENWVSNTNLGASLSVSLAPTATTITANTSLVQVLNLNPQGTALRSDMFSIGRGKTGAFSATNCSTSGTTLTIGTLTTGSIAVGQCINTASTAALNGMYIVANISGSGSGSTWTISGSPGTLSGLSIVGTTGYIGGTGGTTVDALADLRLIKNAIKGSGGTTQILTSSLGATLGLVGDTVTVDTVSGSDMLVLNPGNTVISSNTITLENSTGTDYLVIDANKALFSKPVRTTVTTGTVAQGGTFTPAATANNSIIVEITAGAGVTSIDVNNLTVAGENGIYDILVFNNTGGNINANGLQIINGAGNIVLDHAGSIANGARAVFEVNCIDIYAAASFMSTAV